MPRFVILEHDHPALHWDLMLEAGQGLRTWRLTAPPAPGQLIPATAAFDHRKHYLDYEGPVGANRGQVRRWDHGEFEPALAEAGTEVTVVLTGQRLRGQATLRSEPTGAWTFRFEELAAD